MHYKHTTYYLYNNTYCLYVLYITVNCIFDKSYLR